MGGGKNTLCCRYLATKINGCEGITSLFLYFNFHFLFFFFLKGGEVMMFEGPFAKKLKILSEDYYYDMEWLKSQVNRGKEEREEIYGRERGKIMERRES